VEKYVDNAARNRFIKIQQKSAQDFELMPSSETFPTDRRRWKHPAELV